MFAYDPLRLAVDVRGVGVTGYELAPILREIDDMNLELAGENVIVAVFGMGEQAAAPGRRLVLALREWSPPGRSRRPRGLRATTRRSAFAPPPPWGEL